MRFLKAVAPFFIAEIVERGSIPLIGKVCLRRWGKSAQVPEIIADKWRFCTVRQGKIKQKISGEKKTKTIGWGDIFEAILTFCASALFRVSLPVDLSSEKAQLCNGVWKRAPRPCKTQAFPKRLIFSVENCFPRSELQDNLPTADRSRIPKMSILACKIIVLMGSCSKGTVKLEN